jgi:hypothetical protein
MYDRKASHCFHVSNYELLNYISYRICSAFMTCMDLILPAYLVVAIKRKAKCIFHTGTLLFCILLNRIALRKKRITFCHFGPPECTKWP